MVWFYRRVERLSSQFERRKRLVNDLPRQKLIEIVADRQAVLARTGRDVTTDAKLCEALLRDLCGEHRREIAVLVAAQKERVAADLLAPQARRTARSAVDAPDSAASG